jgi:REP element-mobilizing transposase RayT
VANLDYQRAAQHVTYLVWCPKRWRKVFINHLGRRCEELRCQQRSEKEWTLLELAVQPDHIYLFV